MGIFFDKSKKHLNIELNIKNEEKEENIIKEKEEEGPLIMKIYLCGNGKGKESLIRNAFKDSIKDEYLKTKADIEFKTDQFHWILKPFESEALNEETCNKIVKDIEFDRNEKIDENNQKIIMQRVIICFGENKLLDDYYDDMRNPKIILVTPAKCELNIDQRYITNIITENMEENDICSLIISSLWEIDCYFNERDNKICRYSPENIFKGFETDNSLFSINILLTGISRVGKSSLINLLAGKMIALEGDDNDSVTKKITEYYIYKNDDKEEHAAIKLIDTPGFVANRDDATEKKILEMIKNNHKETNLAKKIHFIFFILKKGENSLEGDNIKELFESLRDCQCQVFFIINGVNKDDEDDENIEEFKNIIEEGLGDYDNLFSEDNCICSNFKDGDYGEIHGIKEIYQKMANYLKDQNNNIFNEELKAKMDSLLKDFRKIEKNESFISLDENENKLKIQELKTKINFSERIEEIKRLWEKNKFLSNIDIEPIIANGRLFSKNSKNVIISLSCLEGILPSVSKEYNLISILMSFMVKEIKTGYGLNINSLNYGLKLLKKNSENVFEDNKLNNNNNEENQILNQEKVTQIIDPISKKVNNLLENSNKNLLFQIAKFLDKMANNARENQLENVKNFNLEFANIIENFCCMFFEKEIIDSEKLIFMSNYYYKLESLFEDINYYAKKEDWGKYKMEITQ